MDGDIVGDGIGATVGAALGDRVGLVVGVAMVGNVVGIGVDGDAVGIGVVGDTLGVRVGELVGEPVLGDSESRQPTVMGWLSYRLHGGHSPSPPAARHPAAAAGQAESFEAKLATPAMYEV